MDLFGVQGRGDTQAHRKRKQEGNVHIAMSCFTPLNLSIF